MKSLNPTQQACLEAMGIDVWVSRDSAIVSESVVEPITKPELSNKQKPESVSSQLTEHFSVDKTEVNTTTSVINIEKNINESVALSIPKDWAGLKEVVVSCQNCSLHTARKNTVFGQGNENADWLIIGDVPTESDDLIGQPFTGLDGDLLAAMLRAMGLTRQQVYITNTLKCTPPNKREPEVAESESCIGYLKQQINLVKPKVILILGQSAAQRLLNTHSTLARLRLKIHSLEELNIPIVVTFHPSSLLSMPANKANAWQDLLFAQKTMLADDIL